MDGRPRGDTHPRAGGRKLDILLSQLPAARVARRAPRPAYRVYGEQEYLDGADPRLSLGARLAQQDHRGRRLHRFAGAAALGGALGTGVGVTALAALHTHSLHGPGIAAPLATAQIAHGARDQAAGLARAGASGGSGPPAPSSSPAHAPRLSSRASVWRASARPKARATIALSADVRTRVDRRLRPAAPGTAGPRAGGPDTAGAPAVSEDPGAGSGIATAPPSATAPKAIAPPPAAPAAATAYTAQRAAATVRAQGEFGFER